MVRIIKVGGLMLATLDRLARGLPLSLPVLPSLAGHAAMRGCTSRRSS
jgi:hypothetical protein